MRRRLVGRLVFALVLAVVAFAGVYVLTDLAPGDPLEDEMRSSSSVDAKRHQLGLDRPLPVRLAIRMARLAVLDLGTSLRYDQPVLTLVAQRATTTLQAGLAALLLALLIGVPAGVLASRSTSRVVRHGIAGVSILLLSIPALVFALLLAVIATSGGLPSFAVMVISLALPAAALIERLQARGLDGVQHERCLDAARARGVPRRIITWRHAWPLSLPAVLGLAGTIAGQLLSGALAVELVTSRSGLGLLTFEALHARDMDLAAGCAGTVALIVGLVAFSADVIQAWMDPRIAILDDQAALPGGGAR
ncbi:Oligopeptide transport system permease protein OppB [Luteitalea pratensis]|uniref:Oligopeptide transport system permease protein OppB n=1 Tax=Luteitalea pratensis TaxID=1855912 RepID=A0A143PXL8_LUTPR|nr:ABC transporter permease [Luteitalea pratensis]AMY12800.1 Oligopeptide transport system permease protein OppB [Luteitalea pratensis]